MSRDAVRKPPAEVRRQLEAAQSQLALYARDLKHVLAEERAKAQQLTSAYKQLQVFAKDLKSAFEAQKRERIELERAYLDTVRRLTRASQYRDEETGAHIKRLSHYSRVLAQNLGLSNQEAELIFEAAPMHDVGKIGVPDAVLHKEGPLNKHEWETMKRHAGFGASLLKGSPSPLLEAAREIALTHHERWDGTGYPQGLRGDEIPMIGRIVMIVDQYDALRSKRPYKPPFDHDKTRDILVNGDGRTLPEHFDPRIHEAFRAIHHDFEAIFARISD